MVQGSIEGGEVLFSGNLATPRRTVVGVLAHIGRLELPPEEQARFFDRCGLPPIALTHPDIPISLEQELTCMARIVAVLAARGGGGPSPAAQALEIGLDSMATHFGMLGLTLMYAVNVAECARVLVTYPELSWGHSRLTVRQTADHLVLSFVVDAPLPSADEAPVEAVRRYCVTVDAVAAVRVFADVLGPRHRPVAVGFSYPAPADGSTFQRRLGCPVRFDTREAYVAYPLRLLEAVPVLANPIAFRVFEKHTEELAKMLRSYADIAEQVRRLLWTTSPPPDRDAVASMLAMSPRTLARKLSERGTRYSTLQREVQCARAEEYLRRPDYQVAEVAALLGFADATAFSRAFRSWRGESPSAWRKRALAAVGRP